MAEIIDNRAAAREERPTEFHLAVTQLVMKYVDVATDETHLAALAKAQIVAGRTVRRIITRSQLGKGIGTDTQAELLALVREEDAADEAARGRE